MAWLLSAKYENVIILLLYILAFADLPAESGVAADKKGLRSGRA